MSDEKGRSRLGGKGAQLQVLRRMGLPVPEFFVIPVGAEFSDEMLIAQRRTLTDGPVAVRSSAVGEDALGTSFAGQFDSVLCVDTDAELLDAVKHCYESVNSERVRAYCQQHGLAHEDIEMAVVIQAMFPAHTSGILFTADPASVDSKQVLISAVCGLGEGAVSGSADADIYRVQGESVVAEIV